jgi:hypothetical protein
LIKTSDKTEKSLSELVTVHEFIREYCKSRKDLQLLRNQFKSSDFFVEKVIQLYDALVVDDIKAAVKITEEFYTGLK